MALRDETHALPSALPLELRDDDRFAPDMDERDAGRSKFAAFLMGGVVVAGGLLAFLYYDSDNLNDQAGRDLMPTGSITQSAPAVVPSIRLSRPETDTTKR